MKIKLKIGDRITMMGILPTESDFITMKKIKDFGDDLNITDKEMKEYEVKLIDNKNGNYYAWNEKGKKHEKEFDIGDIVFEVIKSKLKDMNRKKEISVNQISLYEKFVEVENDKS